MIINTGNHTRSCISSHFGQFMAEAEQVGTDFAKLCYSAPTNERRVA